MATFGEPALIITDGGIAGLLACYMEGVCRPAAKVGPPGERKGQTPEAANSERKTSVAWLALAGDQVHERSERRALAARAAELCHLGELLESPAHSSSSAQGLDRTAMLMAAGTEAIKRGLSRIVWPIHLGGEGVGSAAAGGQTLDAVAAAYDRATVCARLLSLDAGPEGLMIQTPFVDFTDSQLADLAGDVDLPLESAFTSAHGSERDRWEAAFKKAGVTLPLGSGPVSPMVRPMEGTRLKAV